MSRLLLCLVFLASTVLAGPPMTKITLHVKSVSDKPVERASVVVKFVEGRSVIKLGKKIMTHWELRTNQEGVAKIPALPQGKIQIQIIAKGFQTFGNVYDVDSEEKTIEIKLNPPQPQYSAH